MNSIEEARKHQRRTSFGMALEKLHEACEQDYYTELERAGLIKTFEFCFELAWNVLKDQLTSDGHQVNSPRSVIRLSAEVRYIDAADCELLLEALEKRNILSHAYRQNEAKTVEVLIKKYYHPVLTRLYKTLNNQDSR